MNHPSPGRAAKGPVTVTPQAPWRMIPWFSPPGPANMLVPQGYDVAWTSITQAFNENLDPGLIDALGTALAGSTASETVTNTTTEETVEGSTIANFPSATNAAGDRVFQQPTTCTQTPITATTSGQLLPANSRRTLLIVQNNSTTGGATFWVAFGQPASAGQAIGLSPGQSLTLDASCPRDSVNLLVSGAAGTTQGVVVEGSYNING